MAVVGVIAYRISTLAALQVLTRNTPVTNSTFIASTAEVIYQNASLVTTVTAACINLLIIIILNFVSVCQGVSYFTMQKEIIDFWTFDTGFFLQGMLLAVCRAIISLDK